METILREAVGWLSVLVFAAGTVVSAMHLGRVRFAGVLMGGFGLQALVSAFFRVYSLLALHGGAPIVAGLAAVSLVGLVAQATIVAGVALVLAELRRTAGR